MSDLFFGNRYIATGVRFTEVAWPPNTSIEDTFGLSSLESSLGFCKEKPHGRFCDIPDASAVMQGKEPLMTVCGSPFPQYIAAPRSRLV